LAKTVNHFWPELRRWLAGVTETRAPDRIVYAAPFLIWMGWTLFLLKLGARRQLGFELNTPEALDNLNRLSGCRQETLAHHDTLNHFLGHVHPAELGKIRRHMVHRLIRMKVLDRGRLMGYFLIVVDATGQLTFEERHCPHCLERVVNGKTLYFHYVLEAKLVTPEGLAISVGSEFIENADPKATKQDCELKAFCRLAPRLKKAFPQLNLCLCLDALYANGTVLDVCEQSRWKYVIVFKQGSLPSVWEDYQGLLALSPETRRTHEPRPGCQQRFAWAPDLQYVDDQHRSHRFNAFQCIEKDNDQERFFAWITNFSIRSDNVATLANRGGRCRWKIENEGFNAQKNGGFNLEHAYSIHDRQIKNYYLLLQIAHLILQLMEKGNLLGQDCRKLFGSLRTLSRRLGESLRYFAIPADALDPASAAQIQIRLDSS
jgi:hypothetical protein